MMVLIEFQETQDEKSKWTVPQGVELEKLRI